MLANQTGCDVDGPGHARHGRSDRHLQDPGKMPGDPGDRPDQLQGAGPGAGSLKGGRDRISVEGCLGR